MHHDVRHIAVNKNLARIEPGNLVGRHSAVGTADPHVTWPLLRLQLGKETRPLPFHLRGPGTVVGEEIINFGSHDGIVGESGFATAGLLHRFRKEFTPDQHAANFTGARANLVQLGIAPQATQRVFVDIAVAAKNLNPLASHPGRLFRAPQDD